MARLFVAANSEFLVSSAAPVTAAPLTFSGWFYHSNESTSQEFMYLGDRGTGTHFFAFSARSSGALRFTARAGPSQHATTSDTFVLNTWNHACGVARAADDRSVFLNGGGEATNTTSSVPASINAFGVGARCTDSPSQFFDGRLAEFGVWNVALSDAEVVSLSRGVAPSMIRPNSLVLYTQLHQAAGDDYDAVGGLVLTDNGTVTGADHPGRIFYPGRPSIITGPAVTAITDGEIAAAATSFDNRPRKPGTILVPY